MLKIIFNTLKTIFNVLKTFFNMLKVIFKVLGARTSVRGDVRRGVPGRRGLWISRSSLDFSRWPGESATETLLPAFHTTSPEFAHDYKANHQNVSNSCPIGPSPASHLFPLLASFVLKSCV